MLQNCPKDAEELLEQIFYYMNQLVNEKDFDNTVRLLTDMGRTLVNAERASFWYWDKAKGQYWTLAASERAPIVVQEGTGIVGASIGNNETIVINAPYEDERFNPQVDKESGFVTRSILCMPVTNSRGEVIGAYQAINKIDESGATGFEEIDVRRLTMAAAYSGKALESYLLYQASQKDQLTGLCNRRGFYEYYGDYVAPTLKTEGAAVIMCDIDFFKKVNDTYGHNAGDAVLVYVANTLEQKTGKAGRVIRWGGEEFVILLPGMQLNQAAELAESIRVSVEQSVCHFEGTDIKVTMSFGVNEIDDNLLPDSNVEIVDGKLYQAKTNGRNQVVK